MQRALTPFLLGLTLVAGMADGRPDTPRKNPDPPPKIELADPDVPPPPSMKSITFECSVHDAMGTYKSMREATPKAMITLVLIDAKGDVAISSDQHGKKHRMPVGELAFHLAADRDRKAKKDVAEKLMTAESLEEAVEIMEAEYGLTPAGDAELGVRCRNIAVAQLKKAGAKIEERPRAKRKVD